MIGTMYDGLQSNVAGFVDRAHRNSPVVIGGFQASWLHTNLLEVAVRSVSSGQPGRQPMTEKRELDVRLIHQGVSNSAARRLDTTVTRCISRSCIG